VFVMNDHEAWDGEARTLRLQDAQHEHECAWSFDGERLPYDAARPAGMTISRFWILPVAPLGNASVIHTCRGYL
jgi:hypothetical protein